MLSINYSRYSFQPKDWIFTFTCCRNYNLNVPKCINPSYNKILTLYICILYHFISFKLNCQILGYFWALNTWKKKVFLELFELVCR